MKLTTKHLICLVGAHLLMFSGLASSDEQTALVRPQLQIAAAEHNDAAAGSAVLAATRVERRIVTVGDHGVVLLSDDDGKSYRQAKSVPVSSTLTAVTFVDGRHGWAVGHWGVILMSADAGETWTVQHSDIQTDQPLFSVYFKSASEGWAVGLWSLMLHTADGGATWTPVMIPSPAGVKKINRNFNAIFSTVKGTLIIACEQGRIVRSTDQGVSWTVLDTGYAGSFWSGVALQDGTVLAAGMRGTIYRSTDDGLSWNHVAAINPPLTGSITALLQQPDQSVVAIGLDGTVLTSNDLGLSFSAKQRTDKLNLTAAVAREKGDAHFFSVNGPVLP